MVPNPEISLQAHSSTYAVDDRRILSPRVMLNAVP
jgi:hypothetical protein